MARRQRPSVSVVGGIVCALVLSATSGARALYLDDEQNVTMRARIYSHLSIRTQDSQEQTFPTVKAGQMVQNRYFFNPELDAKLIDYTGWMTGTFLDWMKPDDLRFRVAGWGYYDGIYDYGPEQFNRDQKLFNASFQDPVPPGPQTPAGGWSIRSTRVRSSANNQTFKAVFGDYSIENPRKIYAYGRRVNELYLSYSKGPYFFRLGRQSISWGESDTIALLDQTNPFNVSVAAPGLFQDIDEARIPLWTLRGSVNLFDVSGPLSSGVLEGYLVPGNIDVNFSDLPQQGISPYSPGGPNPQVLVNKQAPRLQLQSVLVDHRPNQTFKNSRWGIRLQTVLNRTFTLQGWVYRTFPTAPVPRKVGFTNAAGNPDFLVINGQRINVTEIVHKLTTVYGLAGTAFAEPLDSIVRMNFQLFQNEPGFIPEENLGIGMNPLLHDGNVPRADIMRFEIGLDRFFFFRPLNPTNSFVLSTSVVGNVNFDETDNRDFRAGPLKQYAQPLDAPAPNAQDFVQLQQFEGQMQITVQTDYMHGRIQPRVTVAAWNRGTYFMHPSVIYRLRDWLLLSADYVHIGGMYQSAGYFRDRDQLGFRVTYQLN